MRHFAYNPGRPLQSVHLVPLGGAVHWRIMSSSRVSRSFRRGRQAGGASDSDWLLTGLLGPTAPSFLPVWPQGDPMPAVSQMSLNTGTTTANTVITKIGATGQVSIYRNAGATHLREN